MAATSIASSDDGLRDRATRLFEFLQELQRLRTRVVRSYDSYRSVLWLEDLPDVQEVLSRHRGDEVDAWLVIDRVERTAPPAPPTALAPWLTAGSLRDSTQDAPGLSARTLRAVEVEGDDGEQHWITEELLLEEHPEVASDLAAWLPEWRAWAVQDRRTAKVADSYQQLYTAYQDARALAETYETIMSFGLLTTRSGGQAVRRHVLTVKIVIELDLETGRLSVVPAPDAPQPTLEQDMLDPTDSVPDGVRAAVRQALAELEDPWAADPAGLHGVLRTWVNGLSADSLYLPQPHRHEDREHPELPAVSFAPALVLRERTRGSFIAACSQIIDLLRDGAEVPHGVRQFVDITDGSVSEEHMRTWSDKYADAETYFPKPSNEDQRLIVQRLSTSQTVVVQGPPGTGKTHTIANLVTDLLAHGQRVLITSTTTRALSVLKGQLPEEVRDLCVSVTDDAVKGQADLERSVTKILSQADSWNFKAAASEAATLRETLTSARADIAQATDELRSIREQESYGYAPELGDYQGTLQQIATRLAEEESRYNWLASVPTEQPALDAEDALELLTLMRAATPQMRARAGRVPDVESLPLPAVVHDLAMYRDELLERGEQAQRLLQDQRFHALVDLPDEAREQLAAALAELERRTEDLARRREPWVPEALQDLQSGRDRALRHQHEVTQRACDLVQAHLRTLEGHEITGLETLAPGKAHEHSQALLAHLRSGKRLKGALGRAKVAREAEPFLQAVRVDGRRAEAEELLAVVEARLAVESALLPVEQIWSIVGAALLPPAQRVARLQDDLAVLGRVLEYGDALRRLEALLGAASVNVDAAASSERADLAKALDGVHLTTTQRDAEEQVQPALQRLRNVAPLREAVPAVGAAAAALEAWAADEYENAYADLLQAAEANVLLTRLREQLDVVRSAAPALADALEQSPHDALWKQRLIELHQAWAWRAWDTRVRAKTDPSAEEGWREQLRLAETEERRLLRQLASNRGWDHCVSRLTPHEMTYLSLYSQAVRRAGKGTGKYAPRHQADARSSLREAQTAVPAWIMPMHRVFETVPVDRSNLFDVVIVDEASQSGLEAVLLSWLAPRLVIVGDDKQVSPSNVGLDHEAVYTLQDRYLAGIEAKSLFGPMSSFFDQAVAKSRARIMLREHFRCMPEIIGFSNELAYDGQLIPLRQYGADRLPPLRSTYVRGALVSGGRDIYNLAEADALVEQVAKCCADPAYDGRTMGVLTLLGNAQDKLIMSRLVERLGIRDVEERRLRAGNAEAFQGDERHVMFVSMVSGLQSTSGPARIGPLSKESDQQRLNVAASRAQDQVWLFHSVQPGDLSQKDLRRRYLQYVIKPTEEQDTLDIGKVSPSERHEAFDSLLEQRVFLALRDRGYRVRPQLKVGHYRIDLVVEGGTRRLAVECDGDAFHGAESYADDVARQRDLERVGWTFWRVRGSAYSRDPGGALRPLWALLDQLGIEPAAPEASAGSLQSVVDAAPAPADFPDLSVMADPQPVLLPPAQRAAPPSARQGHETHPRQVAPPRVIGTPTPPARFRNGKMLLTSTARNRVEMEVEAITAWLAAPPPVSGVDGRSFDVQKRKRQEQVAELQDRLDYLHRVVMESVVEPGHQGGQWVTPGCMVGLRFDDDPDVELCVVSAMPLVSVETIVSPWSELGKALEGLALGEQIRFDSARGVVAVEVREIVD
jgi:very-short-patch-repair endonuclease/transcription elongation GreA/GreB family factor